MGAAPTTSDMKEEPAMVMSGGLTVAVGPEKRGRDNRDDGLLNGALAILLSAAPPPLGVVEDTWRAWCLGNMLIQDGPDGRPYRQAVITRLAQSLQAVLGPPWQRAMVYGAMKLAQTFPHPDDIPRGLRYSAFKPPRELKRKLDHHGYAKWDPWAKRPGADPSSDADSDDGITPKHRLWSRTTLLLQIADGLAAAEPTRFQVTDYGPGHIAQGVVVLKDLGWIGSKTMPRELCLGLSCPTGFPDEVESWLGGPALLDRLKAICAQRTDALNGRLTVPVVAVITANGQLRLRLGEEKSHPQGWPPPKRIMNCIARRWPHFA